MVALIIETATERAVTAIVKEGACLYAVGMPFGFHNSKYLIPKIEEGLIELKMNPGDLDVIVVGMGPGSYTGIRVGAAVAKTLSYACKIPLVGVGTLESFLPDRDGTFCSILDAKLSGFYVLKGRFLSGEAVFEGEPRICSLQDLEGFLSETEILVTPNLAGIRNKIESHYPNTSWEWQETAPDPLAFAKLANKKLALGEYSLKGELHILYLK